MKVSKTLFTVFFTTLMMTNAHGALIFTLSAPEEQYASTTSPTIVETFDDWQSGKFTGTKTNAFGTYEATRGKVKINSANKWGGSGGSGKYLFIPRGGNEMTLTFTQPVGYFGFWWSAGDGGNRLGVKTRTQDFEFSTSDILNSPSLTAAHYGNPSWGNPSSPAQYHANWEPFAFVNLFADTRLDEIESIRFYGSNFESDNHTVIRQLIRPTGARIAQFGVTAVPSPASFSLLAMALAFLVIRRRKQST